MADQHEPAPRPLASEREKIDDWRIDELQRAGYDTIAAYRIAKRHDVDLHEAIALLENGCSQELALRILL